MKIQRNIDNETIILWLVEAYYNIAFASKGTGGNSDSHVAPGNHMNEF